MQYYYPYKYLSIVKEEYQTLPINTTCQSLTGGNNTVAYELHNHESLEINAVIKGKLRVTLDGTEYLLSSGEAVLANPFALHSGHLYDAEPYCEFLTLIINLPKLMPPDSPLKKTLSAIIDGEQQFDGFYGLGSFLFERVCEIHRLYHDKSPQNDALVLGCIYSLLGELIGSHCHDTEKSEAFRRDADFLRRVCGFVNRNYMNEITTRDAAAEVYMEISRFCRVFRAHFGTSFSSHLCRYRVERAAGQRPDPKESMADIARSVGFRNYRYFSRSFRKYIGVSPAGYFNKRKNGNGE